MVDIIRILGLIVEIQAKDFYTKMNPLPNLYFKINTQELRSLFYELIQLGYSNIGPVVRDGTILLNELKSFHDLPRGYKTRVTPGMYELRETQDGSFFSCSNGPQSFKKFLYPPKQKLWSAERNENEWDLVSNPATPKKMAFWGMRACDIRAMQVLDRIFLNKTTPNPWYKMAREQLFTLVVGCTDPSANCFCSTMNGGPFPLEGFDFMLTEFCSENNHFFILQSGSSKAQWLAEILHFKEATQSEARMTIDVIHHCRASMRKRFDASEVSHKLRSSYEHPEWAAIAEKCLSCANCTLVCPTCFCSTTEDATDITGDHTDRWLHWDSCFNGSFTYIHGGKIRGSTKSKYRQWLTHKFSNWHDQFGSSGCVGCGRCITWCPVGIDITEELQRIIE